MGLQVIIVKIVQTRLNNLFYLDHGLAGGVVAEEGGDSESQSIWGPPVVKLVRKVMAMEDHQCIGDGHGGAGEEGDGYGGSPIHWWWR